MYMVRGVAGRPESPRKLPWPFIAPIECGGYKDLIEPYSFLWCTPLGRCSTETHLFAYLFIQMTLFVVIFDIAKKQRNRIEIYS